MIRESPDDIPRDARRVLNGTPLGVVECIRLEPKAGILAGYVQGQQLAEKATFGATKDMLTSLDYAIMRAFNTR